MDGIESGLRDQVDVTEIEDGGLPEPIPGAGDPQQAAADAVANAEGVERELHSFEIDPTQVSVFAVRRAFSAFYL